MGHHQASERRQDKARGKLFAKFIRQVEVAAREGGGDLTANATLRTMYQKARDSSVPMDTIERAIKRGTGELEGVRYEPIVYEGYAPCGVAVIVECLTDNRNRTGAEIRNLFSKNGGSMAEPGAVGWQFERKGIVTVPHDANSTRTTLMEVATGGRGGGRLATTATVGGRHPRPATWPPCATRSRKRAEPELGRADHGAGTVGRDRQRGRRQ